MHTTTGRIRYRSKPRLFGKPLIVVQAEFRIPPYTFTRDRGDGWPEDYTIPEQLYWKDATLEDLTVDSLGSAEKQNDE